MAYHETSIGFLGRVDKMRARRAAGANWRAQLNKPVPLTLQRQELLEVLERTAGQMTRAAHQLGIGRRHLYKLAHGANLFREIEEIRSRRRRLLMFEE